MDGLDVLRLKQQMETGRVTARQLLKHLKVGSVPGTVYDDDHHFPFYYYLGQQLKPEKVLQIGPYLGVPAGCFMQSCETVKEWWAISERNTYVVDNLRRYCRKGSGTVVSWDLERLEGYEADVVMISEFFKAETYLEYLRYLWDCLKPEGYLVADYISTSCAFRDFCRMVDKTPSAFGTRYSAGILRK